MNYEGRRVKKGQEQAAVTAADIKARLHQLEDPVQSALLQRYFKTGAGQYGEGDIFIGVRVPHVRGLLREFRAVSPDVLLQLLQSPVHDERLFALLGMVREFERGDDATRAHIYEIYLNNTSNINNWDLVDCSAPRIVGGHLLGRDRQVLYQLVDSSNLWERRIAVLATFLFIRYDQFEDSLKIAHLLLRDREDLVHKAAGWMLRELGKRNQPVLEGFLREHAGRMPRTMLRYAIERLPEQTRRTYLEMR